MSNTAVLWQEASKRKFNKPAEITPWQFKDDAAAEDRPLSQTISYNFWDDLDYLVRLEYDPATNLYMRFNGSLYTDTHIDANYNEQIGIKNVILQEMGQRVVEDGSQYARQEFDTIVGPETQPYSWMGSRLTRLGRRPIVRVPSGSMMQRRVMRLPSTVA